MANSAEDNARKSRHGVEMRNNLDRVVEDLLSAGVVVEVVDDPKYGLDADPEQFKAKKLVVLNPSKDNQKGERQILFASSSFRSDRLKSQQWDAFNIKNLGHADTAYWVISDDSGIQTAKAIIEKIRTGQMISAIDDIYTLDEYRQIQRQRFDKEQLSPGKRHDVEGRDFEALFCQVMGDANNLERFNGGDTVGFMYSMFETTFKHIGIDPGEVVSIQATTDIPRLSSGGQPKTDVALDLTYADGLKDLMTFSLKHTSKDSVSVHEYTADAFANVLGADDELRTLLNEFQRAGSAKAMASGAPKELKEKIAPYKKILDKWVFAGEGAPNVLPIQVAQFLVIKNKDNGSFRIHSVDEYCDLLENMNDGNRGFGTIFNWTYPSKKRGHAIQLKCAII